MLAAALPGTSRNAEIVAASSPPADDWQACAHLAGPSSGAGDLSHAAAFCFPSVPGAFCDKLHLGWVAALPWGWDNSLLETVANLRRSRAPRGRILSLPVCT